MSVSPLLNIYGSVHEPELFEPGVRVKPWKPAGYPLSGVVIGTTPDGIRVRWAWTPKTDEPSTVVHSPSQIYLDMSEWLVRAHCARWLENMTEKKYYWLLDGVANLQAELSATVLSVSVNRVLEEGRPIREIFSPWERTQDGYWCRYSFMDGRVVARKQDFEGVGQEMEYLDSKAHAVGFWLIGYSDQLSDGGICL